VADTDDTGSRSQQAPLSDADAAILGQSPLLADLSESDADVLRPHVRTVSLHRGDRLFAEGDIGDQVYFVIEGKVKLTRTAPDGRENLISVHGPGEMFGELAMFDPTYRTSTATAITDARLASIAHQDLRHVLMTRPAVSLLLLKALAQRLRRVTETNTNLIFTDVPGRVAKALLELADKFGMPTEDGIQVNHDLTQEELAQLVGASRETVNKALADFATRGWIQLAAKSVLLIDPDRLRRRARLGSAHVGRQLAAVGQVGELGADRELGERPQRAIHVGVDSGHDLGSGAIPGGESGPDLGEPLRAMR
jgi:CRP/FNR family transcriptional regulator, cyclic AMP receptor protein